MLLTLLAAGLVQAAIPPAPSPELQRQLACPVQAVPMPVPTKMAPGAATPHVLAAEPDAHMIRPVARNYCEGADVVRYFVSSKAPAIRVQEPGLNNPRTPARP